VSAPGPLLLLVEDEPQMRRFLRVSLASAGFRLIEAATAAEASALATSHNPDLVLLDLGLPDRDGLEVTRRLREWSQLPIVVVSARGREADKVEALDAGADDYLTKPFGVNELLARIRAALRRPRGSGLAPTGVIEIGPIRIDPGAREVTVSGRPVRLTPIEYRLLVLLTQNPGKVLTHRQILGEVWGPGHASETHYLRVYMAQLRRKIEPDPARPRILMTEQGVGYRLREP
jgi:two-component system KDP operon response regulator KdpE